MRGIQSCSTCPKRARNRHGHVFHPTHLEWFQQCNVRARPNSIDKRRIFTFSEVYKNRVRHPHFERNSHQAGSFGIDSALDFPTVSSSH
jgi:hypothetical protein